MTGGRDILIIDDSELVVSIVEATMIEAGHVLRIAGTAKGGFEQIARKRPDLLILDINLPDMSGHQICERLKNDTATRTIPILMCTALSAPAMRAAGLHMGADDYICKPFSTAELRERVNAMLRQFSIIEEQARKTLVVPPAAEPTPAFSAPVLAADAVAGPAPIPARPVAIAVPAAPAHKLRPRDLLLHGWRTIQAPAQAFVVPATPTIEAAPLIAAAVLGALAHLLVPGASAKVGRILLALVWPPLLWLLFSALSLFLLSLMGKKPSWSAMRRIWGLSAVPLALSALLTTFYVVVSGGLPDDFSAGPLLLAGTVALPPTVTLALAGIDVFQIWAGFLVWTGLKTVPGVSGRTAATLAAGAWIFSVVLQAAWHALIAP
jgi:CheY-like chemotaxis protein